MAQARPAAAKGSFNGGADGGGGGDYFDQLARDISHRAGNKHPIVYLETCGELVTLKKQQVCIRLVDWTKRGSITPDQQQDLRKMVADRPDCTLIGILARKRTTFEAWMTDMTKPATLIMPDAFNRGPKG